MVEGQALVVPEPKSPLQPTQVLVAPQTGVVPVQAAASAVVHWTHAFVDARQTAVPPEHCALVEHVLHWPVFAPLPTQTPARHCALAAQVPWSNAMPQRLSAESHAPETQARTARGAVHAPPGTALPFGTRGWHVPAVVMLLQKLPVPQSASTKHVVAQTPVPMLQKGAPLPHGCVAFEEALPLQAKHTPELTSQIGVVGVTAHSVFVAHAHVWVVSRHEGALPPQNESLTQPPQLLIPTAQSSGPKPPCGGVSGVPATLEIGVAP